MTEKTPSITRLLDIMRRLRDPDNGCAWDIKQDFQSISPFTVEEAYEVADAIERNDLDDLCDELGDLLFQVVFHAQMASEQGAFTFEDVTQSIIDKMLRRHPHVFGDVVYETEADLKAGWEAIKAEERRMKAARIAAREHREEAAGRTPEQARLSPAPPTSPDSTMSARSRTAESSSALDGIAHSLPALMRADKLQRRAARNGFDWPDIEPVWGKLDEEIHELRVAVMQQDPDAIEDELGDLLFTAVNLARHCGVDSEQALQRASRKFDRRFRRVEELAANEAVPLQSQSLDQLDALWDKAKTED